MEYLIERSTNINPKDDLEKLLKSKKNLRLIDSSGLNLKKNSMIKSGINSFLIQTKASNETSS